VKRELIFSGIVGLVAGLGVYLGASVLSAIIPTLLGDTLATTITFAFFLSLSLLEIPVMVFGLRQMVRSLTTPRWLPTATFGVYVGFAFVYASLFVVLTSQVPVGWAMLLLGLVRFASGALVK
jgi:hypothetical protein